MKKYFLILVIAFFSSCNSDDALVGTEKSLQGRWSWTGSTGGIAGTTDTPKSTDKVIYLEFSGANFKTYVNGKLTTESPFTIKTQKSVFGGERPMIVGDFMTMSFEFKEDKLYLNEECYDCYGSSYIRIN